MIKTNFLQRNFMAGEIAQKIYREFVLPQLQRYEKSWPREPKLKNIIHINTAVGKAGAAKVAYNYLSKNLILKGYNSKILAGINYGPEQDDIAEIKPKDIKLHKMLHRYSKKEGLLDFYNLESFNIHSHKWFKKADIVHLHNLHGAYFSPFVLPYLTSLKPTVWTLHDEQAYTGHCSYSFTCDKWLTGCGKCPDLDYYPKIKKDTTEFLMQTKKAIYDASEFTIVCPSQWHANRVNQSILKTKPVKVIYNGIDEKVFSPTPQQYARKELNLPLNKKILLFSASGGIANKQKGGKYILEAYKRLKNNNDILFINLGANKAGKKQNWLDIPYIKDENMLAKYYSAADLFIYPTQAEVFGLVITEAMACKTPVVAFNNTAVPELVRHMETGYLAKNSDIDDFVHGIQTLMNKKLDGDKARRQVLEKFTLDKMVNEYIELYKTVLEDSIGGSDVYPV